MSNNNLYKAFQMLSNETKQAFECMPNGKQLAAQIDLIISTLDNNRITLIDAVVMLADAIKMND